MDALTAPHYEHSALITIDTQCDVLDDGPFAVAGTSAVVPTLAQLGRAFRGAGRPVVHVVRLYAGDGNNAEPARRRLIRGAGPLLRPGTPGRRLAPGLLPGGEGALDDDLLLGGGIQRFGDHDAVLYKPRWGAFFRTPLDEHLRALGVDTLVVTGCNFPNCPRTSVYEASERDYRVVVVADGVSGLYERGVDELQGIGVHVLPASAVLEGLGPTGDRRASSGTGG
jgi:nicotinamidase-related amidase